jgi:hypothetical protein
VAALSTIMPLRWPIELALITPLVLMTESTTVRAAAAVSSTRPPFALILPSLETSDLSGRPVATSMTFEAIWSLTASVTSLSPYMFEREAVARRERHGAERGGDGSGVAHAGCDQRRKAAAAGGDPSLIDDRGVRPARDVEVVPPGHEVRVLDVVGGGEEARRVYHGARAEQDAVAVDDEYPAVRRQRAEDLRWPEPAGDTVEYDRRAAGLIEPHALVRADIEGMPIDGRAATRLVDRHRGPALPLNVGGATDDRAAGRAARSRRHAQRNERRGGEDQVAVSSLHRNGPATAVRLMKGEPHSFGARPSR